MWPDQQPLQVAYRIGGLWGLGSLLQRLVSRRQLLSQGSGLPLSCLHSLENKACRTERWYLKKI